MKQTNGSELLERVSALADGQLEGDEFARAVDELGFDVNRVSLHTGRA